MSITRYGILAATNNPKNVVVCTSERFFNPTGRVVSRKVLLSRVEKGCEYYKNGSCKECATDKEVACIAAWKLTVGTGKKLY